MNIFLIMLISLFMGGYYMFFAPNTRVAEQETDHAIVVSDLRSIAECALAVHNAEITGGTFNDVCVEQNQIKTERMCFDARFSVTDCLSDGYKRPQYSFIITTTGALDVADYNAMMEILEKNFSTSGTLGIYQDNVIMVAGSSAKQALPKSVIDKMELENGQLIYMTHFDIPDAERTFTKSEEENVVCPAGTQKVFRFGRWQCVGYNIKTSCGGDQVWDASAMECVPDDSRKPLCAGVETAVMIDGVWECVAPFGEYKCPGDQIARLNYETLQWECTADPTKSATKRGKCTMPKPQIVRGRGGATLRVVANDCTDCEKAITNEETCTVTCVPDLSKLSSPKCYPGRMNDCRGSSKAFYFGFPNEQYAEQSGVVPVKNIPFDKSHSQNRRFNCLDCGKDTIDSSRSIYPYVAVCKSQGLPSVEKSEFDIEKDNDDLSRSSSGN